MTLIEIRQSVAHLENAIKENLLMSLVLAIATILVVLFFGGLMLEAFLEKRKERQKAEALERLHKHLNRLPSVKS